MEKSSKLLELFCEKYTHVWRIRVNSAVVLSLEDKHCDKLWRNRAVIETMIEYNGDKFKMFPIKVPHFIYELIFSSDIETFELGVFYLKKHIYEIL